MVSLQSLPAQLPFGQKKEAISPLEIFSAIDEDNSGTITRTELETAMKTKLKMAPKQIEALFVETDSDGNGSITMQEFSIAIRKHPELFNNPSLFSKFPGADKLPSFGAKKADSTISPIEYFHKIDSDGNGSLSLDELTAALKLSHISDSGIKAIFEQCDRDGSGSISLLEWTKMTKEHPEWLPRRFESPPAFISTESPMELFHSADKDGSGTLSKSEFTACLKAKYMAETTINQLFSIADADNSGEISMLEWSKACKKSPELVSTQPSSAFKEKISAMDFFAYMDKDSSGSLSKSEFSSALIKANLSDAAIDKLFTACDADGSGEISMLEWANAIKKYPELVPEKLGVPPKDNPAQEGLKNVGNGVGGIGKNVGGLFGKIPVPGAKPTGEASP